MKQSVSRIYLATIRLAGTAGEFAIINGGQRWVRPEKLFHGKGNAPMLCCRARLIPLSKAITLIQAELRGANTKGWKYDYSKLCKVEVDHDEKPYWLYQVQDYNQKMQEIITAFNLPITVNIGWHRVVIQKGRAL